MNEYKWAYANYALQAFCGMLNEEDTLFITYMRDSMANGYQPVMVDLSANKIQDSVNTIRKHQASGGTPYSSVEVAYEKLKSEYDSNPNTQYWLVIITDGEFAETDSLSSAEKVRFLNDHFAEYTSEVMPNGTHPQLTFMGIGSSAVMPDSNPNRGIYTYYAANEKDITDTMANIADRISGRTRLGTENLSQVNENTIQVSSSIPLLNIVVFSQKNNASLVYVNRGTGRDIPITRSVSISYNGSGISGLRGDAYLIGDSNSIIDADTYRFEFNTPVNLSDIVILFEPALEIRLEMTVNGKIHPSKTDFSDLHVGDRIKIAFKVYEMNTDKEISPSLLPNGTKFLAEILEDGRSVAKCDTSALSVDSYVLNQTETILSGTITIEGFNPITASVRITPGERTSAPVYTVESSSGDGSTVSVHDMEENTASPLSFRVLCDGVPVTDRDTVLMLSPTLQVTPDGNTGEMTVSESGEILFVPYTAAGIAGADQVDVTVTCALANGASASSFYTVLLPRYEVVSSFKSNVRSVRHDEISANTDLAVVFTVLKDEQPIQDVAVVQKLSPVITASPSGNSGDVEYRADGSIVFTPKAAGNVPAGTDSLAVTVTCTLNDGTKASEQYLVLVSDYAVVPVVPTEPISTTDFYGNEIGAGFFITKDGKRLSKQDVDGKLSAALVTANDQLNVRLIVQADGTIICIPYADQGFRLNFFTWWGFWFHYCLRLPHGTITIGLSTPWASGENTISIAERSIPFILLTVVLPFVLEIAILTILISWAVLIITKPKFANGAKLYVGSIRYDENLDVHVLRNFSAINLTKYNQFQYIWKFKRKPEIISIGGIKVCADYGNNIICHANIPWYRGSVTPKGFIIGNSPSDLERYIERNHFLMIRPFSIAETIQGDGIRSIFPASTRNPSYYVTSSSPREDNVSGRFVIRRGTIFLYTIE